MRTLQKALPETDSEVDSAQGSAPAPRNRMNRSILIGFTMVLLCLVAAVVWFVGAGKAMHVHDTPSPIMLAEECDTTPTGRELKAFAPGCIKACPHVCHELNATIHRIKEGASLPDEACHGPMAQALVCAVDRAHSDACAPVLDHAERMGAILPRKPHVLDSACGHGGNAGGAVAKLTRVETALWKRALQEQTVNKSNFDVGVAGKRYDERCHDKGEGNTCISKEPGAYIYCSLNKRFSTPSAGWSCVDMMGFQSRCLAMDKSLTLKGKVRCDDPFCRNGGAERGDGEYCHKDSVVQCTGDQEPKILESCDDKITFLGANTTCFKKSIYECVEGPKDGPHCKHDRDVWVDPFQLCSWGVTGPCTIDPKDRFCIQSANFPNSYGNNERCEISIPNMPISVESFSTKPNDKMVFGEYELSGSLQQGQVLHFGLKAHMVWTSDSGSVDKGWKLCARANASQNIVNA